MGTRLRVIDFENPANNDRLAVNQFTVTEDQNNAQAGRGTIRQRFALGHHRIEKSC